mmetsp:Transcript_25436/g.28257  ORF Transcript_25436/g.28257 Transcript_25436/m.28257 type:complete len:88 (+) Transcript_25436:98-361(+)
MVEAFSHSQDFTVGDFAFGDRGQNYKNLVGLMKYLKLQYDEATIMGCPTCAAPGARCGLHQACCAGLVCLGRGLGQPNRTCGNATAV